MFWKTQKILSLFIHYSCKTIFLPLDIGKPDRKRNEKAYTVLFLKLKKTLIKYVLYDFHETHNKAKMTKGQFY